MAFQYAPPHAYTVTSNIVILTLSIYDEAVICTPSATASQNEGRGCSDEGSCEEPG